MSFTEGTWTAVNSCTDQISVTFTATDECGLTTSTQFTFTITDTTPPAIAGGANGTGECTGTDPAQNAAYIAWRNNFGGVTATDICGTATMSFTEGTWTAVNSCTDQISVTFTATDECGLTTSTQFTFTITDTTPPAIAGGANGTGECTGTDPAQNAAYIAWRNNFGGVTATDICGTATMSFTEGTWTAVNSCTDQISVTFTATDECGLTTSTSSHSPLLILLRQLSQGELTELASAPVLTRLRTQLTSLGAITSVVLQLLIFAVQLR